MDADRLQLMLDKHELRELGLTYCRGIDRQDFALVHSHDQTPNPPETEIFWPVTYSALLDARNTAA